MLDYSNKYVLHDVSVQCPVKVEHHSSFINLTGLVPIMALMTDSIDNFGLMIIPLIIC
jgi:hypothetical protein